MAGAALLAQGIATRRAILKMVRKFTMKNGYSPSVQEIADALDLASPNAVRHHLLKLRDEGWAEWPDGRHRQLRITKKGRYPR